MVYTAMSAEKINSIEISDLPPLATPEKNEEVSSSGRVDINILLNRARKVKGKRNKNKLGFSWVNSFFNFCCWSYFIFLITYFHI